MEDLGAHRLEQIAARLERLGGAAADDRELAGSRALGAAAHWGVEHRDPARRQLLTEPLGDERIDRAHADHDVPRPGAPDDPALTGDDRFGLRRGLDDADRACRARRHALGGVGDRRAFLAQRLDLHGIDVVDDQREPVLDEVQRHRPPHRAEPDESDGSSHLALLYLLPSRAASTVISAFHPVNLRFRGITVCLPPGTLLLDKNYPARSIERRETPSDIGAR